MDALKETSEAFAEWALWIFVAVWGGVANYTHRVRMRRKPFSWLDLLAQIIMSGFCGLIALFLAKSAGLGPYETGAVCGIVGHMGGRSIDIFEDWVALKFGVNLDGQAGKAKNRLDTDESLGNGDSSGDISADDGPDRKN